MAEAIVNVVVKQLILATMEWLKEDMYMIYGVKEELENMSIKMQSIQKVLHDAENKSMKESTIKLWLEELQDLSYDMEDVFDEWNTRVLIQKHKESENHPSNEISSSSSSNKFTCLPLKQFNCFTSVIQIGWRRNIALRIKAINERMNLIFSEMDRLSLVSTMVGNNVQTKAVSDMNSYRITTSLVVESEVHGRDDVKNLLLSKVLSEGSEKLNSLQVISIVGVGGIGKTTLAQLVYNNEKVKAKFAKRIWVCVSDTFDEVMVARAILEGMEVDHNKMDLLQNLHESIQNSLSIHQFLLVLDDVWDEKFGKWNRLRNCLVDGGEGSTVIVTTRSEIVAKVVGTMPNNMIKPALISDEDCWSLMRQIAFHGKTKDDLEKLEGIGRKIAKKCKGLPLAARTLGGLLISKSTEEEWTKVLESEIWELEDVELDLFPHLFLSYRELPPALKRCFSCLALFPKDSFVLDDQLISLWMAHGYLKPKRSKDDLMQTGQEYFKCLVSRALFEEKSIEWAGKRGASMHDIMHDFALHLVGYEFLSIVQETGNSTSSYLTHTKARHLLIRSDINPISICDVGKLRSCLATRIWINTKYLVKQLKVVRALYLSSCGLEQVPQEIGKLIHLRTLDLSNNPCQELPETIGDLYNLQSLSLVYVGSFSSYPKSIGRLINLHDLRGKDFRCGGSCNLGLLKNLNKLGGALKINFTNDYADEVDAKEAELKQKLHLLKLVFAFNNQEVTDSVLEALQPPPNLRCLEISNFRGSRFPSWITSLQYLTKLLILNTKHILSLPPLGKLVSLKELLLSGLILESISREFLGIDNRTSKKFCAFPELKELEIYNCRELKEWEDLKPEDESTVTVMPKLHILTITICSKLEGLPRRLLKKLSVLKELNLPSFEDIVDGACGALQCLRIYKLKSTTLPNSIFSLNYLTKLIISGGNNIVVSLPALGILPSLEELDIRYLSDLEVIGREFLGIGNNKHQDSFAAFPKLVKMELHGLEKLKEWEDIKPEDEYITFMPKLGVLMIHFCKQLQMIPRQLLLKAASLETFQFYFNSESLTESLRNDGELLSHIKEVCLPYEDPLQSRKV